MFDLRAAVVSGQGAHRWADEMTTDIRTILDFVLEERLRFICERTGVSATGSRSDQRERVARALGGNVRALLPLLMRAELVELLATRDVGGGRYALVSRASREDLERLLTMLCIGDPKATEENPLGESSPVRFERKIVRSPPPPPGSGGPASSSEKVFRARIERQRGLIYYVKNGDVWAAPIRRGGSKRPPHRVHQAGVPTDNVKYLYYIDTDGDIARKRRDGGPVSAVNPGTGNHVDAGPEAPVRVFVSYSRRDHAFFDELYAQLSLYQATREIDVYFDRRAYPGTEWEPALKAELERAEVAILLLSSDFFNSQYCYDVEWPLIWERRRREECELGPVLIRGCRFEKSAVGRYQIIRPRNNLPVIEHAHRDTAWTEVALALEPLFELARAKRR